LPSPAARRRAQEVCRTQSRTFRIREHANAEFGAEAFNATNHPNFDIPNTTPTSSAFGGITNTLSEPRGIRLALKIAF
jgi:hypothetical protein